MKREVSGGFELDDGLGIEIVEGSPFADRKWLLHTADAHGRHARFGFGPPSERVLERQ